MFFIYKKGKGKIVLIFFLEVAWNLSKLQLNSRFQAWTGFFLLLLRFYLFEREGESERALVHSGESCNRQIGAGHRREL